MVVPPAFPELLQEIGADSRCRAIAVKALESAIIALGAQPFQGCSFNFGKALSDVRLPPDSLAHFAHRALFWTAPRVPCRRKGCRSGRTRRLPRSCESR